MNLNQVNLIGRITRDIELKKLPSGTSCGTFSLATNRVYYNQDKEKIEDVEFHNILAWGKQAETLAQYAGKGDLIYLGGRLQTRSWEDKDTGKKMYRTEVVVESFQFAPKATNGGGNSGGSGRSSRPSRDEGLDEFEDAPRGNAARPAARGGKKFAKKGSAPKRGGDVDPIEYPDEDINPEDIPF